jgi:hypothetical protein
MKYLYQQSITKENQNDFFWNITLKDGLYLCPVLPLKKLLLYGDKFCSERISI